MKYTGIYILLTVLLLLAACTGKLTEGKVVTVTIEPQRFFAERIAGDKFVVHCVVPSGQSPETYDPTPKQMVQIGQSEAYLQIGYIGFEQVWMQKIRENNPDLKIFDVSKGMQFVKETEEGEHRHEGHEADDGHHHHHADEVFTSWGKETAKHFTKEEIEKILSALNDTEKYGFILRAKGIVAGENGEWIHFDFVPKESNVRNGSADYTGRLCVIGSKLNEAALAELFDC